MPITNATFTPDNAVMLHNTKGVVPKEYGTLILESVMQNSLMMQLAKYEDMNAQEKEFDVFLGGLGAYWVGEGQRIETSSPKWTKVNMKAKKLGVIIPISREYLNYKQPDFWNLVRPSIAEAFYKKFDAATFLGLDSPFDWNVDKSATAKAVTGALDLKNYDAMVDKLNDDGYEPNAIVSKVANKSLLKALVRETNGVKLQMYDGANIEGVPVFNLHKDIAMNKGTLYAGDFNYAYYGIPYDLHYMISEEAQLSTVKDADGNPLNLFEREMVALRATMDVAFMIVKDDAFASLKAPVAGG